MRRWVSYRGAATWLALLVLWFGQTAFSQQGTVDVLASERDSLVSAHAVEIGDLLRRGRQLEIEHRWGEALSHYEDAVRAFPEEPSLGRRFQITRMHYDLGRRYNDASFRESVNQLSAEIALDLYCEVLLKIQSHYVEAPHLKELVELGTNNFEVALSEPLFQAQHLPDGGDETIKHFPQTLRRLLGPLVIQNREDARDAVATAAEEARKQLGIAPAAVVLEYMCGATNSLDPYSAYLTPNQLTDIYSQIEGNFVGLGIELKVENRELIIVRVISNSPAQRGGIRDLDRILAVDGQATSDLTTDQAANLLQGEAGSIVELTVSTPGEMPRHLRIQRQRVDVPSVDNVKMLDRDYGIGYFKLTCFQKTTSRDLDSALWKLHRQGMRRLVIDVRGNPGGLLITAVEVADKFVDRGVIVSTRGRDVREGFTYSAHTAGTWQIPLVVLIDRDSASAAEIFAGAIRDHRRGTVVGQQSYGKGSVQGIFPLTETGAGLRLTTAKFYSPKGHPFSLIGVTPHIQVHQAAKAIDGAVHLVGAGNADPMLSAALEAARDLTAQR